MEYHFSESLLAFLSKKMFIFLIQCFSQYFQNSKNDGTIKGTADHSLVEVNGHSEDEIASQGGCSLLLFL